MDNNRIKMSFVDKSLRVNFIDKKLTIASIQSGFKFTRLDAFFEQVGFKSIPDFVVEILEKYGYKKDYSLGMWITKTSGESKCNDTDEYDKIRGRRISVSRAKKAAYINASRALFEISDTFFKITSKFGDVIPELITHYDCEDKAINNVIEHGVSNPKL